jgi:hypothetical protein
MKVKYSMLTYAKIIIGKVSFCSKLTEKEYRKALSMLSKEERDHLKEWFIKRPFARRITVQ